jgi:hypothetical protein
MTLSQRVRFPLPFVPRYIHYFAVDPLAKVLDVVSHHAHSEVHRSSLANGGIIKLASKYRHTWNLVVQLIQRSQYPLLTDLFAHSGVDLRPPSGIANQPYNPPQMPSHSNGVAETRF